MTGSQGVIDNGRSLLRRLMLRRRAVLPACGKPSVLGRLGTLETRLADGPGEIRMAQALRYKVFCDELAARPGWRGRLSGLDRDRWDRFCDHLLVFDKSAPAPRIVATYRLLPAASARRAGIGFYSQAEFDIESVIGRFAALQFMELGRSCVLDGWRSRRTIELLWHGTWAYVRRHGIDVMFGCASFPGTQPQRHAEALSFLRHTAAPDPEWDVRARPGRAARYVEAPADRIDARRAVAALPPLVKGYLRLGAWIGRDAVVDHQFGTTDVMIVLPVSRISPRYVSYYGADADRHAAT